MDDILIAREIASARAENREISDACARMIASQYHDDANGLALSTTGAIIDTPSNVWRSLFYLNNGTPMYPTMEQAEKDKADMLGTYLTNAGERGPVAGWSKLWLRD